MVLPSLGSNAVRPVLFSAGCRDSRGWDRGKRAGAPQQSSTCSVVLPDVGLSRPVYGVPRVWPRRSVARPHDVFQATVDLRVSGARQVQQTVWQRIGLTQGTHTIRIVNRSTSVGMVDALRITP